MDVIVKLGLFARLCRAGYGWLLPALLLCTGAMADNIVRPDALQDEVDFWKRVFAEVPSDQALVHDNRYLSVVYEVVPVPRNISWQKQRRQSEIVRDKYRDILLQIAEGDRSSLSKEQARVLALWPADVSNNELRQASRRVRFQGGLSDRFVAGLQRSGNWRDYITQQLSEQQVPNELVALPHVESSFNPAAGSSVGAVGLWQFTRSTGSRFMQIDNVVDERRDPFVSSAAAAQLLSYNHSILNSWPLAITAYNHGVAGMRRAVEQLGTDDIDAVVHNYGGKRFGFASRNFYVAFLAASEVDSNYANYFGAVQLDPPANDLLVSLPAYVEFDTLSQVFGLSENDLRRYNPSLMPSVLEGTKYVPKGFRLRLPYEPALNPELVVAGIPAQNRYASQTPDLYHKVRSGDSLSVIAARYDTSVRELVALNNLGSKHFIRAGQVLKLPYSEARNTIPENQYKVKSGDTLSEIAARAGTTRSQLAKLNNLGSGNQIYAGQVLLVRAVPGPVAAPVVIAAPEPVAVVAIEPEPEPELAELVELTDPAAESLALPDMAAAETDDAGISVSTVDPSNYEVAEDGTIQVQASETMGHYADWLNVSTQSLRELNGYNFQQPLVIGARVRLKFPNVPVTEFTDRRVQYHKELQETFFVRYRIVGAQQHTLRRGISMDVEP
jgi:membrane-bound lytic murein transglycosylase D